MALLMWATAAVSGHLQSPPTVHVLLRVLAVAIKAVMSALLRWHQYIKHKWLHVRLGFLVSM
jgi:hypothetical protein